MNKTEVRAIGYIRVSDNPQAELDRASFPEQERGIREHAKSKGYRFLRMFSDVGRRWEAKKQGFQDMIGYAKANLRAGDVIVVWCADRIVGSASTAAALEPLLDQGGINIEGVVEPIDKRWLLFYAMIGKGETEAKRERGRLGIRTAVGRRHYVGTAPYGRRWNKQTKQVELEPEEASWYRRMFIDWREWSSQKISTYLNHMGVPTRLGGKIIKRGPRQGQVIGKGWTAEMVRRLRTSPTAYGEGRFKLKGSDELAFPLPGVVSKAEFDTAQRVGKVRQNFGHRETNRIYPVPHRKFKCFGCGLGFRLLSRTRLVTKKLASGEVATYQRKRLNPSLVCYGMSRYPHLYHCREKMCIDYEKAQGIVLENVERLLSPEFAQKLVHQSPDTTALERKVTESVDAIDNTKREISWLIAKARQHQGKNPEVDKAFDVQLRALTEGLERQSLAYEAANQELARDRDNRDAARAVAELAEWFRDWTGILSELHQYRAKGLNPLNRLTELSKRWLDETRWLDQVGALLRDLLGVLIDEITVMPDNRLIIRYNIPVIREIRSRQLQMAP